jgi:hypothetical protein
MRQRTGANIHLRGSQGKNELQEHIRSIRPHLIQPDLLIPRHLHVPDLLELPPLRAATVFWRCVSSK